MLRYGCACARVCMWVFLCVCNRYRKNWLGLLTASRRWWPWWVGQLDSSREETARLERELQASRGLSLNLEHQRQELTVKVAEFNADVQRLQSAYVHSHFLLASISLCCLLSLS